jgi:HAE1 family hydrophobic/amphiphilic exporter-1
MIKDIDEQVLVIQFGSFLDPLAIMISLPLSLIDMMLAFLVTGSTLNLVSSRVKY